MDSTALNERSDVDCRWRTGNDGKPSLVGPAFTLVISPCSGPGRLPEVCALSVCCVAKRLLLPCSADGAVLALKAPQHVVRRSVGRPTTKNRVRGILNGKLDFLSSRISSQKRDQHKGRIQPGRHSSSADDFAIHHDPCIHEIRAVVGQQVPCGPVCRHLPSCENTARTTKQGSGANGK